MASKDLEALVAERDEFLKCCAELEAGIDRDLLVSLRELEPEKLAALPGNVEAILKLLGFATEETVREVEYLKELVAQVQAESTKPQ